jgi:hypothetical protein
MHYRLSQEQQRRYETGPARLAGIGPATALDCCSQHPRY